MKLSTDKKDKNVLSLYLNSSGDIISASQKNDPTVISFNGIGKITDILTTKSAVDLSMSKKQLVDIETTVPGYKRGFILQTGIGFSSKKEVYLFPDSYITENFTKYELNVVDDVIRSKKSNNERISLTSIIGSVVNSIKEEYPHLKASISMEQDGDVISIDYKRLKILLLSLCSMAFEADIADEIKITVRKRNGKQEVILTSISNESNFLNGIVDFCNAYPFSTTSAMLVRALSNEMNITLSIFQEFDYLEMLISFDEEKGGLYGVYAENEADDDMLYKMCMNMLFNKINK